MVMLGALTFNAMHNMEAQAQLFPKQQILDSSKIKDFADDNFKFDENGTKNGRKHCGKRRNCSLRAFSPFPSVFKRLLQQTRKNQGLYGTGFNTLFSKYHSYLLLSRVLCLDSLKFVEIYKAIVEIFYDIHI